MDQSKHQADCEPGKSDGRFVVRRTENRKHQEHREHYFTNECGKQRITTERMFSEAIGPESCDTWIIARGRASGDKQDKKRSNDRSCNLRNDVSRGFTSGDLSMKQQPNCYGRVDVASGDGSDCVNHC